MIGIPKTLQTKADYLRALEAAAQTPRLAPAALAHFRGLLSARMAYVFVRHLNEGEEYEAADGERIVEDEEGEVRSLLALQEQPDAALFGIGFTVKEVQQHIKQLENAQ